MSHSAKSISIIDMMETRTILRTIQNNYPKLKNNEPQSKFTSFIKKTERVFGVFWELFLTIVVLMGIFKNKNSLRAIEAQIVQKLKVTVQFERCFRLMEHISVIS